MYISARERAILKRLVLDREKSHTLSQIADALEVSTRTIQRDLRGIEDILKSYQLSLVKNAQGMTVTGTKVATEKLESFLRTLDHEEYTPEERQMVLLSVLLHRREPVKLFALANELNVTVATVSHDLTKVEGWLEQFQLKLIRKRGYGVEIVGNEVTIRRALSKLISENINEDYFYHAIREEEDSISTDPISKRLLHYVDLPTIKKIKDSISSWRKSFHDEIADSSYVGLIVHLALAIERLKQGERIELEQHYLQTFKNYKEFEMAESLAKKLENLFEISIPETEIGYITMHLRGAKWLHMEEDVFEDLDLHLAGKVKEMVERLGIELDVSFTHSDLIQGLIAHLRPALYRIHQKMKIQNPLLSKIKSDYQSLFEQVQKVVQEVFEPLYIPDEEIGFLVMHFGSVLEELKRETELRALVICSSGIGSSKLLASRLNKEFPEITLLKNVSLFELRHLNTDDYDLIISTIPIQGMERYFLVNPFLSKAEVVKIREYLENYVSTNKKKEPIEDTKRKTNVIRSKEDEWFFQKLKTMNEDIYQILHTFELKKWEEESFEKNLYITCQDYQKRNMVTSSTEVFHALLDREKIGSLAIPNTSLALFHCKHPTIQVPSFSIYQLKHPVEKRAMDNEMVLVNRVLVLLAPEPFDSFRLTLMSYISGLLVEEEDAIETFETKNEQEIYQYLGAAFKLYVQKQL
ncbi:putative transcriptional antiterminator [Bacillus sp. TS-2]|nr:putative transcriptional antiterminator [Bacillus sp. TS-2]